MPVLHCGEVQVKEKHKEQGKYTLIMTRQFPKYTDPSKIVDEIERVRKSGKEEIRILRIRRITYPIILFSN